MEPPKAGPTAPPRVRSSSSHRTRRSVTSPPVAPALQGTTKKPGSHHQDLINHDHQVIINPINVTPIPKGQQISEGINRNRSIQRSKTQPIPINGVTILQREEGLSELGVPSSRDGALSNETDPFAVSARRKGRQDGRSRREKETSLQSLADSPSKTPRDASLASSFSSRKVFKFFESRQNSFSNYLTQSRKESGSSSDKSSDPPAISQPPGILVRDRDERENLISKSGSLQEIGNKIETSPNRRRRKDFIRRSVHFPENEAEYAVNLRYDAELLTSLETLKKNGPSPVPASATTNYQLKKEDLPADINDRAELPKRSIQKSSSTSFEGLSFPKKVSFQSPPNETEKGKKNSTTPCEVNFSGAAQSQNVELDLENSSLNSSGISRVGGVHFVRPLKSDKYSTPDSNSPDEFKSRQPLDAKLNSAPPVKESSLDDRFNNTPKENAHLSGDPTFSTLPRRNPVHKNSVARQLSKEEESFNPPLNIKRRVLVASTGESPPESKPPQSLNRNQSATPRRENPNHAQENPPQNSPTTETQSKKLVKSSSTSTFRFFPQNIQLPSIPNKPSRKSGKEKAPASTAARSRFFSELKAPLSPELADYLYRKMKGTHEGILVTACRLGEEEQILKLIKELTAAGHMDASLVNQRDRTGRTALGYASVSGHTRVVMALTDVAAADLNLADSEGNTPLHLAAQAGHPEVVSHLVNRCGGRVELDPRNCVGFTPLMKAALQGRTKIAKTLLFAGASPHLRDFGRGLSALEWARFTGRHLCCDLIESVARSCSDSVRDRWSSDPDLNVATAPDSSNSWLKHKLQRAFHHKAEPRKSCSEYRVVTNLPHLAKCATSPLLPPTVAASVVAASRVNVIPSLQVTEVKVADCYQDPEDALKRTSTSSPPDAFSPPPPQSPAPRSGTHPVVGGPPPTSQYVRKDTPIQAQNNTKKENPTQNYFKNDAPTPSNSPTRFAETGVPSTMRSMPSALSRSIEHDVRDEKDSPNSSAGPQNRRTSSFSSPNSTAKGKPFVSGIVGGKPGVSQSIVTQTSGGRVVTGSVYSKTASVYTIQKSASATKFSSSGPTKFQTTSRSEDSPGFRSSSFDLGYSSSERSGVVAKPRDPANDVRHRTSADPASKK